MNQILTRLGPPKRAEEEPHRRIIPINANGGNNSQFNPKVKCPHFDGQDPKGWVKKCTRYFSLCRIDDDQKVDLASLCLKGITET